VPFEVGCGDGFEAAVSDEQLFDVRDALLDGPF
jgi:hypothetical protein